MHAFLLDIQTKLERKEAIDIALIYFIVVFENNAFIAPYGKKKLVIYLSIEIRRLIEKIIVFDGKLTIELDPV